MTLLLHHPPVLSFSPFSLWAGIDREERNQPKTKSEKEPILCWRQHILLL
jgi:hypothetical protein